MIFHLKIDLIQGCAIFERAICRKLNLCPAEKPPAKAHVTGTEVKNHTWALPCHLTGGRTVPIMAPMPSDRCRMLRHRRGSRDEAEIKTTATFRTKSAV